MTTAVEPKKVLTVSPYARIPGGYLRRIKCARHYILKQGGTPFVMEPDPRWYGKFSEKTANEVGFSTLRRKKDKYGQWIQNFKDYYQPIISPHLARERWYDPVNHICQRQCKRQCILK